LITALTAELHNFSPAEFAAILPLPCCRLGIRTDKTGDLNAIFFLPPDTPLHAYQGNEGPVQSLEHAVSTWLKNPGLKFDLPVMKQGTPFQRRVWQAIYDIPAGEIRTYGEISADVGGTARAVGQACGANPFPVVVPCHRVVAKTGIGGFANARDGWLLDTKRWLLKHEGVL
jgi:methylated-DNA-[protein]-cysteine S-methyltransferase